METRRDAIKLAVAGTLAVPGLARAKTSPEKTLDCLYMPDTVHDVTIVDREQK